jgi:hypothetical protein
MPLSRGVIHVPVAISLYKDMSCNASSHYTHMLPLHLHITHALPSLQHVSLPDPRMERASILQLWLESKAGNFFGAEHIWKEMLGLSWQHCEWWCKLVYLKFIKCWLQWQYYSNILVYNPARCCGISKYLFTWIHMSISYSGNERGSASSSP